LVQPAGSILKDEISIFTLSSLVEDYYGLSGVCLNLPSLINKNGIKQVLKIPLSESELEKLKKSASILKEIIRSLNT
jgi:L-lactate dehydrogenase